MPDSAVNRVYYCGKFFATRAKSRNVRTSGGRRVCMRVHECRIVFFIQNARARANVSRHMAPLDIGRKSNSSYIILASASEPMYYRNTLERACLPPAISACILIAMM